MTDGLLGSFNLNAEIERFHPGDTASGRRAETLIKTEGLRVVLVTMRAGISLHDHTAPGPITIHALTGRFTATYGDQERELSPGDVVSLAPGIMHAVKALEDGAFLLTIAWGAHSSSA